MKTTLRWSGFVVAIITTAIVGLFLSDAFAKQNKQRRTSSKSAAALTTAVTTAAQAATLLIHHFGIIADLNRVVRAGEKPTLPRPTGSRSSVNTGPTLRVPTNISGTYFISATVTDRAGA